MNADEGLAGIESFADAKVVCDLGGGLSSDSYLIERGTERFALRIDTPVAAALGLDREAEVKILEFVHPKGLGPKLEFFDPANGILVTRYAEGRTWSEVDLHAPEQISKLAALLQRLHSLNPVGPHLDLDEKAANYARIIDTRRGRELAGVVHRLVRELDDPSARQCLCHNDLNHANIIEEQGLLLIDWEYAAIGDPCFDLATVAEHHRLTQRESDWLLRTYFGKASADDTWRVNRYRLLYKCLVALWSAAAESIRRQRGNLN